MTFDPEFFKNFLNPGLAVSKVWLSFAILKDLNIFSLKNSEHRMILDTV